MTNDQQTIPSRFADRPTELIDRLQARGFDVRSQLVDLIDAPVWHDGERVAYFSGRIYAAQMGGFDDRDPVVALLDNGELSSIQSWHYDLAPTLIEVQALQAQALAAGDTEQVDICRRALDGDTAALGICADVIAKAADDARADR